MNHEELRAALDARRRRSPTMLSNGSVVLVLLTILVALTPVTADAKSTWQKPQVEQCELAPGGECNLEVSCPSEMPYVVGGGGGMPAADPANHSVAMTMNLPINENTWRVRWKNLASVEVAKVKVAVRVKCSDDAGEAGWK
jgi:hypothetical protein